MFDDLILQTEGIQFEFRHREIRPDSIHFRAQTTASLPRFEYNTDLFEFGRRSSRMLQSLGDLTRTASWPIRQQAIRHAAAAGFGRTPATAAPASTPLGRGVTRPPRCTGWSKPRSQRKPRRGRGSTGTTLNTSAIPNSTPAPTAWPRELATCRASAPDNWSPSVRGARHLHTVGRQCWRCSKPAPPMYPSIPSTSPPSASPTCSMTLPAGADPDPHRAARAATRRQDTPLLQLDRLRLCRRCDAANLPDTAAACRRSAVCDLYLRLHRPAQGHAY